MQTSTTANLELSQAKIATSGPKAGAALRTATATYTRPARPGMLQNGQTGLFAAIGIFVSIVLGLLFVVVTRKKSRQNSAKAVEELEAERGRREGAESANRAKADFLTSMSREIRTPMNAIIGFTELALKAKIDPDVREQLETVRTSADWLMQILHDLVEFSRAESGELSLESIPFALNECIRSAIRIVEPDALGKGLTVKHRIDPQLPKFVSGDPTRLRHVIFNLVENAVKYTSTGGVTITAALESKSADGVLLRVTVADTGIGMPPQCQKALFEPFQPSSDAAGRPLPSGLGLAVSRRLVQLMGGTIETQSHMGAGTTIQFTARLGKATATGDLHKLSEAVKNNTEAMTVLVVDDNAVNRRLLSRVVESAGYKVRCVENGKHAVQLCVAEKFDLVLMDLEMPEMDGLEATRIIRATQNDDSRVPIYALAAHALPSDRDRCLEAGMNGYLRKPIEMNQLSRVFLEVTAQKAPRNNSREEVQPAGNANSEIQGLVYDHVLETENFENADLTEAHRESNLPVFDSYGIAPREEEMYGARTGI